MLNTLHEFGPICPNFKGALEITTDGMGQINLFYE